MDHQNFSAPKTQVTAPPRPEHATDRYDGPTVLYRMYDADDQLLYIGITCNQSQRWQAHRKNSPWWKLVARKDLTTYPDRSAALTAEREAIRTERPLHNVAGHPQNRRMHVHLTLSADQAAKVRALAKRLGGRSNSEVFYTLLDSTAAPGDSDPDPDEALRRARQGGGTR